MAVRRSHWRAVAENRLRTGTAPKLGCAGATWQEHPNAWHRWRYHAALAVCVRAGGVVHRNTRR